MRGLSGSSVLTTSMSSIRSLHLELQFNLTYKHMSLLGKQTQDTVFVAGGRGHLPRCDEGNEAKTAATFSRLLFRKGPGSGMYLRSFLPKDETQQLPALLSATTGLRPTADTNKRIL